VGVKGWKRPGSGLESRSTDKKNPFLKHLLHKGILPLHEQAFKLGIFLLESTLSNAGPRRDDAPDPYGTQIKSTYDRGF
jgi:hypothetical protein